MALALGDETMFYAQRLEGTTPFSPCFLLETGPGKLTKALPLTAVTKMAQDRQSSFFGTGALFGLSIAVPKAKMDFLSF